MVETESGGRGISRILTWRSLVFGWLGILITSGVAGYHDTVLGGTFMIGNHMPGGVFFYLILIGLGWNGGWVLVDRLFRCGGRLRDTMALSTRELIAVLAVSLVACYPPTSGLFRYFHRMVMLPWYHLQGRPDWATHELLTGFLRAEMFPEPWPGGDVSSSSAYERVYKGFFTGLAQGSGAVPLSELPLRAWSRAMFWVRGEAPWIVGWFPLLFLMALSVIALQFLMHRQWSKHEQLSYPVAQVAGSFCRISGSGRGVPDLFKNPLFWWGFTPVFLLLLVMYLALWYPQYVPSLEATMPNIKSWWLPVTTKIPVLRQVPELWSINGQTILFTILGLSYFVSSEISLTMGCSMFFLALFGSAYYLWTGSALEGSWMSTGRAGAYLGYTLVLLYIGRNYFLAVFGRAFFPWRRSRTGRMKLEDDEAAAVMAARVLALAFPSFVMVLAWYCQSWTMAIFLGVLLMVLFLVLSRVVCESGIPFVHPGWEPAWILIRLFGPAAVGPAALTFMLWSTGILAQDPRECLMPYVATSAKVAEEGGFRLTRLFWVLVATIILALGIAYLSSSHSLYNYNPMSDPFAAYAPPTYHLDAAARLFNEMKAGGTFEGSLAASPWERLAMVRGMPGEGRFFVYGILAVIGCFVLRFRFARFPFHPLLFLFIGTYAISLTWGSFLAGWFIKTLVVKFGGGRVYQRLKPLFVGIIAGELIMVGFCVLVDFLYFFLKGVPPPVKFIFLPG